MSELKSLDHKENFLEFSQLHLLSGCPDPHLKLAVHVARQHEDPYERAWFIGCYIGPYEVNTADAIFQGNDIWLTRKDPSGLRDWIAINWGKFSIRRERRAARTVSKMSECMLSYANFVVDTLPELVEADYDTVWKTADKQLRYFGRYALIKVLEGLHRSGLLRNPVPDIRPVGGWSPRETLALIYPQHTEVFKSTSNKPAALELIQENVLELKVELEKVAGQSLTMYEMEVLLCNYRQYPKHHPGWPLDSDLQYYHTFIRNWGYEPVFDFKTARMSLFSNSVLGEVSGWEGPRVGLGETYVNFGYHWSDVLYDFNASKDDLSKPVRR